QTPPWRDAECTRMVQERNEALKMYRSNLNNSDNYLLYKTKDAQYKRCLKRKAREGWQNYVNTLNNNKPINEIWRMARSFTNKRNPTREQIPERLIQQITDKLAPPMAHEDIKNVRNVTHAVPQMDKPFTRNELFISLKTTKNTSPGYDRITYAILN